MHQHQVVCEANAGRTSEHEVQFAWHRRGWTKRVVMPCLSDIIVSSCWGGGMVVKWWRGPCKRVAHAVDFSRRSLMVSVELDAKTVTGAQEGWGVQEGWGEAYRTRGKAGLTCLNPTQNQ